MVVLVKQQKTAAFDALSPTTTLGDIIYDNGTNAVRLAGNTTTTKKFLRETGTGTVSAAPAWDTVTAADVGLGNVTNESKATMFASPTFTGTVSGITAAMVGLGNVSNDAQVKKSASSTNGNLVAWSGTTGDALGTGYSVQTVLSSSTTAIPRADAVINYVDSLLAASHAMIYKGTLGTGGTITSLPTTYNAGWSYKVITAGTYAGTVCEIGDLIIAVVDRTGSGNLNSDWTVVQTNIDGVVTGPASSVNNNFAAFDQTTGKLIKDSGYNATSFSPAGATRKYATTLSTSATTYTVTHNLGTTDAVAMVREVASPFAQVYCDIEFTTTNTITVRFATAPAANTYRVVVIG